MAKLLQIAAESRAAGLEAISFQNGEFFKELTAIFDEWRNKVSSPDGKDAQSLANALQVCTKKYTNLNIKFNYDDWGPAIYIPNLTVDHLFFNDRPYSVFYNGKNSELVKLIKMFGSKFVGTVNLEKSWVSDAYAAVTSNMLFPLGMIRDRRFTSGELAAIYLHETGHMFTTLEYMTTQIANNQVIAAVVTGLNATDNKAERTALLDAARVAQGAEKYIDVERIAEINDPRIASVVYLKNYRTYLADGGGKFVTYNGNSCEQLADQFATRHGAGRELVTGLARIYDVYGIDVRKRNGVSLMQDIVGNLMVLVAGILGTALVTPLFALIIVFYVFAALFSEPDNTYDEMKDRCVRVRNDMMEQLKQRKLSKEETIDLTVKIEKLDSFLKDFNDYKPMLVKLLSKITPVWRENKRQYDIARELETLISNDLFLAAAKLRTL